VPEKAQNGFFAGWQCQLIALAFCPVFEKNLQGQKLEDCNVNKLPEKA